AAREVIANANLRARLDAGADQRARAEVHALLESLLLGRRGEIESRLAGAAQVLSGQADAGDALSGLLPASQLAGLTPEEANTAVMNALAARAYQGGGALAAAQLTRPDQADRVRRVAPLIDAFSAAARARYTRWTVGAGVLAVVLLVLVVGFSRGLWRLGNVGLAVVAGSALGAWAFDALTRAAPDEAPLPLGAQAQGLSGALADGLPFALPPLPAAVPDTAGRDPARAGRRGLAAARRAPAPPLLPLSRRPGPVAAGEGGQRAVGVGQVLERLVGQRHAERPLRVRPHEVRREVERHALGVEGE